MKKLLLFFVLSVLSLTGFAQDKAVQIPRLMGLDFGISPKEVEQHLRAKSPTLQVTPLKEGLILYRNTPQLMGHNLDGVLASFHNNKSTLYAVRFEKQETNALSDLFKYLLSTLEIKYGKGTNNDTFDHPILMEGKNQYQLVSEVVAGRGELNTTWLIGDIVIMLKITRGDQFVSLGYVNKSFVDVNKQLADDL